MGISEKLGSLMRPSQGICESLIFSIRGFIFQCPIAGIRLAEPTCETNTIYMYRYIDATYMCKFKLVRIPPFKVNLMRDPVKSSKRSHAGTDVRTAAAVI